MSDTQKLERQARERVKNDPALKQHANTIFYDWPRWEEHLAWVLEASTEEIEDWALTVERQV
jgi:hypothetical protein